MVKDYRCAYDSRLNIFLGFSLLMFCGTMWALVYGRVNAEINKLVLTVAVSLFALSTTVSSEWPKFLTMIYSPISIQHIVIDIIRIDQGLVKQRNSFPGGPAAFFADVTQSTFISKSSVFTVQTLLGDGVVVSMCFYLIRRHD
jgi:hypothetical protein